MRPEQLLEALGEIGDRHLTDVQTAPCRPRIPRNRLWHKVAIIAACVLLATLTVTSTILALYIIPYLDEPLAPPESDTADTEDDSASEAPTFTLPALGTEAFAPLPTHTDAAYTASEMANLLYGKTVLLGSFPTTLWTKVSLTNDKLSSLPAPLQTDTVPIYRMTAVQYTEEVMDALTASCEPAIRTVLCMEDAAPLTWMTPYKIIESTDEDDAASNLFGGLQSSYTYRYNDDVWVSLKTYTGFSSLTFYVSSYSSEYFTPAVRSSNGIIYYHDIEDADVYQTTYLMVAELAEAMGVQLTGEYDVERSMDGSDGVMTVTLYGAADSVPQTLEMLDTYGAKYYSYAKQARITITYRSTIPSEKSMLPESIQVDTPTLTLADAYTVESESPLISLSEAEYLLACGCSFVRTPCRLCLADRSEVDMTDYDAVTMEYAVAPDEGLLIPCYVFYKYLTQEDGMTVCAKATVVAIPISDWDSYFKCDPEWHETVCSQIH